MELQISQPEPEAPTQESVPGWLHCLVNRESDIINYILDHNFDSSLNDNDYLTPNPDTDGEETVDMEKARMLEVATAAMDELLRLVNINEPLWTRSSDDRRFALVTETYKQMFPKANSFKRLDAREESSKHSQTVNIGGMQLVEMFLDSVSTYINSFFQVNCYIVTV